MLKTSKIIGWSHGPHVTENNNRVSVNIPTVKDNAMSTSLDSGVAGLRDTPVHVNNNNNNMVMPATKATTGASPTSTERDEFDVPKFIVDQATRTTYMKGRFLGKGGFARVHELTDLTTSVTFAGKIIPKSRITKPHHKEKIAREIEVHRHLRHRNVVRFHKYFEDDANVYIILENCSMRSLVHVLKCRTILTEPEVRYYIKQLTEGVAYVHREGIIHRDLKLGNMFLSQEMDVKIGDFGLATRAADNRQVTICGTPNYIAPEVLSKLGHHYQADIWAIGCIMFALLVGQPPFETETLRETYSRITNNQYTIPPLISSAARDLIKHLLHPEPKHRPTIPQILKHDFFTKSYVPETLSPSACTSVPTFSSSPEHQQNNNVLSADIKKITTSVSTLKLPNWKTNADKISILSDNLSNPTTTTPNNEVKHNNQVNSDVSPSQQKQSSIFINQQSPTTNSQQYKTKDRSKIIDKLASVIFTTPASKSNQSKRKSVTSGNLYNTLGCALDHMPSLASTDNPVPLSISPLFISKWIDYSNKYGFGYQLSDGSVGVFFNDLTRINISSDKSRVEFHDSSGRLSIVSPSSLPVWLEERYQLLRYFACYMDENLTEAGDNRPSSATSAGPSTRNSNNSSTSSTGSSSSPSIGSRFSSSSSQPVIPHIKRWDRTEKSIIMQLSSGTFQINFFSDHTKIVVIGESSTYDIQVLYINSERVSCTYRLSDLVTSGCDSAIRERLVYALSCLRQYAELDGEEV